MEDIEQKLLKLAEENVNKKMEEERKASELKIKKEIKDVKFILELIEKKMLYKKIGDWKNPIKFEMITKEIFWNDYTTKPKDKWRAEGITIKEWDNWGFDNYNLKIEVNGIKYEHIGYIVTDFINELKEEQRRIATITNGLYELEKHFEELKKQEKNIIGFVNDYNETKKKINFKE